MSYIDFIIIFIFLLIALTIGFRTALRVNTLSDYILYYKKYNYGLIGLSLSMVIFGSGTILGTFQSTCKEGIIYAVASFGYVINSLITAKFIVPKIDTRFSGLYTAPDILNLFYGKIAEKLSAIIGIIFDIGAASTQLVVLGHLISNFFEIQYVIAVLLSTTVVLLYSCTGGIRAITILDAIKCFLMLIFIPILANYTTNKAGGILEVLNNTSSNNLTIFDHKEFLKYLTLFIFFMLPTHMLQPIVVQRLLLIDNPLIAKKSMYIYGLVRSALIWIISIMALSSLLLPQSYNFFDLIKNLLPPVLQGLTVTTILIIVMCKTDAHLNSSGLIVTKNILNKFSIFNNLATIRLSTFFIGAISCAIAIMDYSIINVIVFIESIWSCYIGIPLIAGILGLRVSDRIMQKYIYYISPPFILSCLFFSYLTPLITTTIGIFMFGMLCTTQKYKNFTQIKIKLTSYFNAETYTLLIKNLKYLVKYILAYSSKAVEHNGADYFAFSIFFCITYTFPYFMWDFTQQNIWLILSLRVLVIVLCLLLLLKPYWPKNTHTLFPHYWHITLILTLPFSNFFILILEHWSNICIINSVLSLFFLALLTDWLSFLILSMLGIILSFTAHYFIKGYIDFSSNIATNYLLIYTFLFSFLIIFIFTRRRQIAFEQKVKIAELFGGTIAHEMRTYLLTIKNFTDAVISQNIYSSKMFLKIEKVIKKSSSFIDTLLKNIKGPEIKKTFSPHSIFETVEYSINNYPLSKEYKKIIVNNINYDFTYLGDREMIAHVIYNLINNSLFYITSRKDLNILIHTEQSIRFNYLIFRDNGPGIPKINIDNIFQSFYSKNKKGTGLGLSFCKVSMNLIKGDITCNSTEGQFTEFILRFPIV